MKRQQLTRMAEMNAAEKRIREHIKAKREERAAGRQVAATGEDGHEGKGER